MTSAAVTTAVDGSSSLGLESTGEVCAPGEIGEACTDPACCASGHCVVSGRSGVCSECDEAADCEPGYACTTTRIPAVCVPMPPPGDDCLTANDCPKGMFCPTVIEVPGILSTATCSECEGDMGCMGMDICTPSYDLANASGYYFCAAPGSVPDDEGCNLSGDGSECASGQCASASLMGIPVVAVCSPCNEDDDCAMGETCTLPEFVVSGTDLEFVPGSCG